MSIGETIVTVGAGLAGALVGVAASELRWRRERRVVPSDEYQKRRRDAYAALWDAVEDAYLEARSSVEHFDQRRIVELTFRVNSFLVRNAPYLDDEDRGWVDMYLSAAFQLVAAVQREGGPEEQAMLMDSRIFPEDFGERVASGAKALRVLDAAGEYLRSRVLKEIGGEPVAGRTNYRLYPSKTRPLGTSLADEIDWPDE